jgi:triacylglycerol lipase
MAAFTFNPQTTEYQLQHAYWLGKAASLAYQDEAVIRAETAQWGFDRCQCFCSKHQPPFLIDDTQAYTIANDQMIITAFRGTTPTMICDWLTDANAPSVPGHKGLVHLGFNLALGSVYPEIREKIKEFRTNNQTLWFTGHSLGGALAMLAAARMYFEVRSCWRTGSTPSASRARAIACLRKPMTQLSSPALFASSITMISSRTRRRN